MRESNDAVMARRLTGWAACAAALLLAAGCSRPEGGESPDPAAALEASLAGLEAVARSFPAVDQQSLRWPSDHGFHPEQFTESWLLAGMLRDDDGRRYGFQLLLQRVALQQADAEPRASAWATDAVWQGVFSVEPEAAPRIAAERFSREALGLAGARGGGDTASAWLEEWRIEMRPETGTGRVAGAVQDAALELSLRLPAGSPEGTFAEARRGYWWPRLEAAGTLEIEGRLLAVTGSALLDRSWGQSPPAGRGQLALARIWMQGEQSTAMRCEQLRRRGGGGVPLGGCVAFSTGQVLAHMPEPAEEFGTNAWQDGLPLEWLLRGPGAGEPKRWAPLAEPGETKAAWSGVIVPVDEGADRGAWGLLSLSNFAAP